MRRYLYGPGLLAVAVVLAAFLGSEGPLWP